MDHLYANLPNVNEDLSLSVHFETEILNIFKNKMLLGAQITHWRIQKRLQKERKTDVLRRLSFYVKKMFIPIILRKFVDGSPNGSSNCF